MPQFVPIAAIDPAAIEALLDRAFGRDRHSRTAYAIRGKGSPIPELSFAATDNGVLVGVIQCWPIELASDEGPHYPLVMVGPVAVEPERQKSGLGKELVHRALDSAMETDRDGAMMLIGDPEYYGRFWGFSADLTGGWRTPGPVEQRRLLARGLAVPDAPGMLGPPVAVPA